MDLCKRHFLLIMALLITVQWQVHAQELSFKDSITKYTDHRIQINNTGMQVLGAWGIANIAEGGIGYFTARQDDWKYFHEMNAIWGVVNTGIAAIGISQARGELVEKMSYRNAYGRYRSTKRKYLISSGLDIVFIAAGLELGKYGDNTKDNPAAYHGFGRSIAIQGIFLLLFDNTMYTLHNRSADKWFRIMDEIRVTGSGIGIIHNF